MQIKFLLIFICIFNCIEPAIETYKKKNLEVTYEIDSINEKLFRTKVSVYNNNHFGINNFKLKFRTSHKIAHVYNATISLVDETHTTLVIPYLPAKGITTFEFYMYDYDKKDL